MIHETLGGGLVGALIIFGGIYAAVVAGAVAGCMALGKAVERLQSKPAAPTAEGADA